jgi:DnaJ-domain-containing protein 1
MLTGAPRFSMNATATHIAPAPTYYDLLQVSPAATGGEVRIAYRRLAQRHHPDKRSGRREAALVMAAINEAYAVLSDPEQRERYDRALAAPLLRAKATERYLQTLREPLAAWPWWVLFGTLLVCLLAIGISVYKGYVPGTGTASLLQLVRR